MMDIRMLFICGISVFCGMTLVAAPPHEAKPTALLPDWVYAVRAEELLNTVLADQENQQEVKGPMSTDDKIEASVKTWLVNWNLCIYLEERIDNAQAILGHNGWGGDLMKKEFNGPLNRKKNLLASSRHLRTPSALLAYYFPLMVTENMLYGLHKLLKCSTSSKLADFEYDYAFDWDVVTVGEFAVRRDAQFSSAELLKLQLAESGYFAQVILALIKKKRSITVVEQLHVS